MERELAQLLKAQQNVERRLEEKGLTPAGGAGLSSEKNLTRGSNMMKSNTGNPYKSASGWNAARLTGRPKSSMQKSTRATIN